jgi:hypothetical protein
MRALGMVLLVGGGVLLVAGIVALAMGMSWIHDASTRGRPSGNEGDLIQAMVMGGAVASVLGLAALLVGVFLVAVARGQERRHRERMAGHSRKGDDAADA